MSEHAEISGAPTTHRLRERMRLHRQRRKEALRCLTIELRETEVGALIRRGLLEADARNDRLAVINAVHAHLEVSLRT